MKLITKALLQRFKRIGDQTESSDPIIITKFFNPCGAGTWYVAEYNPETNICFGYVTGLQFDEWGYFSLDELQEFRSRPFNLPIERDLHFTEKKFSELGFPS